MIDALYSQAKRTEMKTMSLLLTNSSTESDGAGSLRPEVVLHEPYGPVAGSVKAELPDRSSEVLL